MIRKIIVISIFFIALSPVFIYKEYALGNEVNKDQSRIYFNVRVHPWDEFNYYILYSEFRYYIDKDSFRFVLRDYSKSVKSFKIISMTTTIDNNIYTISEFANDDILLDKSNGNGNAGDAGIAVYNFIMPEIPKNEFDVTVNGIITYDNGQLENVSINIPNTVHTEEDTITFFTYQLEKLSVS